MEHTFIPKIVLVGSAGVGKSALCAQLAGEKPSEKYIPTLGVDVHPIAIERNGVRRHARIWDCGGKHCGLGDGYWSGAHGAVVVGTASQLGEISAWLERVAPLPSVVVLNKCDLAAKKPPPAFPAFQCSAFSGPSLEEALSFLLGEIRV